MSEMGEAPVAPGLSVDVLSIFPELIEHYCNESVIGRARRSRTISIRVVDLREGATDTHRSVDDAPFGGGAGMVLSPEPVRRAIESNEIRRPIYLLSPAGRPFNQQLAHELSLTGGFSLLCSRYEGYDERIAEHLVEGEISIGDYVLAGGELGALVVLEAVCRLVPGVLGNEASIAEESFSNGLLEYPQYTRPAEFQGLSVPEVLRSGDHQKIASWRLGAALYRTLVRRPDLIEARGGLKEAEVQLLEQHGYPVGAAVLRSGEGRPTEERPVPAEEADRP